MKTIILSLTTVFLLAACADDVEEGDDDVDAPVVHVQDEQPATQTLKTRHDVIKNTIGTGK